ncbi:MAG: acyltransferase family protein [Pseudohongiella sp.]
MYVASAGSIHLPTVRVAWVDYAKGICIVMVVMMHATLDYGAAVGSEGWLHHVVAFARPFRMPDFFLLAGLFLSASINSPLRQYVDRKFVHFVYFYLIWLLIQLGVTESGLLINNPVEFVSMFLFDWVEPVNTLWFVHMLAIFYMTTRLLRKAPLWLVFMLAAGLHVAFHLGWINTGWSVADRFFDRYIYFFAGYAAAPWIFAFARQLPSWPRATVVGLILWALINVGFTASGNDGIAGISLLLGFMGAAAIVAAGSLLAGHNWAEGLRYCGANSIVIYLSFFLPMKIALKLLADSGVIPDVGWASLLITGVAVVVPLLIYGLIKDTWLGFLYKRPAAFGLAGSQVQTARL